MPTVSGSPVTCDARVDTQRLLCTDQPMLRMLAEDVVANCTILKGSKVKLKNTLATLWYRSSPVHDKLYSPSHQLCVATSQVAALHSTLNHVVIAKSQGGSKYGYQVCRV